MAAVATLVGALGVLALTQPDDGREVASATLTSFGATPPGAHGTARVLDRDGASNLEVHVRDLPTTAGFYEVWLIDPETMQMIAVGIIGDGSSAILPLSSTVDLDRFSLVDVSSEPLDGDPTHSGDSLLRGVLVP